MVQASDVFRLRLRQQLRHRRLSRKWLADQMGVSVATVARWLSLGLKASSYVPVLKISRLLDCSAAYLVGDRDNPEKPEYLTADEWVMLRLYRQLGTTERRAAIDAIQEAHGAMEKAVKP